MADRPAEWEEGVRREPRYRFKARIECIWPDRDVVSYGQLRDISVRGMFVERRAPRIRVGERVRSPLHFLGAETLVWVEGAVARVEADGFAVDFDPHHQVDEATLREVLPRAERLLGGG